MRSDPTWRLAPGQRLMHRCHDGECVLFNDLSGDTHLLAEPALALLQALRDAPQSAAALAAADPASLPELEEVLADLAALYLIDALPC
ncbi:HPr-rel-A system PqqD family peptide chaperone [Massilia sp. Dwa41.01b]|uniref:HPr-rel-A system PqqD family peptide chaperone n=1 Tax=unclassified Massilia TaxID=2609279 RepID=UPI00160187BF|nr:MULTISPECIES: HPr-rel-A system PqqD family peptide chaperone [unclassified Massilia]QNA90811.1 HPr-rel-A system PqqD family peptide chaperone [Massilia sp. Dwa41.01b]QNA98049.1 HPr-rel-A system PqqD family peptide chaperone [Massilia sp. Se16.2.3]